MKARVVALATLFATLSGTFAPTLALAESPPAAAGTSDAPPAPATAAAPASPVTPVTPATPASPAAKPTPQAIAEGRSHFARAVDLFRDGDYRTALIEFNRAADVAPNFRILYNLGQTYFELQDYAGSLRSFQAYLDQGGKQVPAARRTQVEADIEKLKARVAYLNVTTDPPGADLTLDDVSIGKSPTSAPILVSAGRRKITASLSGHADATQIVDLAGGDHDDVKLVLTDTSQPPVVVATPVIAAPPPVQSPPPGPKEEGPSQAPFWIAAGSTTALLATTGVLALVTAGARRDYDSKLDSYPVTTSEVNDARTHVRTLALATDIFGAATAVAGAVTLYITFRSPSKKSTTKVGVRGTGLAFSQSF